MLAKPNVLLCENYSGFQDLVKIKSINKFQKQIEVHSSITSLILVLIIKNKTYTKSKVISKMSQQKKLIS